MTDPVEPKPLSAPLETSSGVPSTEVLDVVSLQPQPLSSKLQQLQSDLERERWQNQDMKDKLQASELLYARLLNELHSENQALKQENLRTKKKLSRTTKKVEEIEQQNIHLIQEVERLKVGRVALKQVIKSFLRRIGFYRLKIAASLPQASTSSTVAEFSNTKSRDEKFLCSGQPLDEPSRSLAENLSSDLVSALVIARSIYSNLHSELDGALFKVLKDVVSEKVRILCVGPTIENRFATLAQAFACRELMVTCVDVPSSLVSFLEESGVAATSEDLGSWLARNSLADISSFGLVCLDARDTKTDWELLNYRVSPKGKLLIKVPATYEELSQIGGAYFKLLSQAKEKSYDSEYDFHIYEKPAVQWAMPALYEPGFDVDPCQQWPWNYPTPKMPETLPSGRPWPKISIITVTLNQGRYLEETIRSVLLQGYPNLEYILLDGCSSDNTHEILERYRSVFSNCIVEPDGGQSNALNKGFSLSTGEILAWLNSDDCYLPLSLFRVAVAFDCYDTDLVVGGCQLRKGFSPAPFKTHHSSFPFGKTVPLPLDRLLDIDNSWQKGEFFYQPEVFWTREIWEKSGAQVSEELFYSMDYELWVRMAQQGARVTHIPDSLALYRVHEQQKTFGEEPPFLPELRTVASRFMKESSKTTSAISHKKTQT